MPMKKTFSENISTMRSNRWLIFAFLFCFLGIVSHAQKQKQKPKREPLKHEKEVRDMVTFLQYMLNTLGEAGTSARDKDVLITESYVKIFRDAKVQIEDDLDEDRTVITNKDVPAYLKDVDFFFKNVKFEFTIEDIESKGSSEDKFFYKVSLTRNLKGTNVAGKVINNNSPRFIEINYDAKDQDLKIVSIYTNQFNEKQALLTWWNELSYEWKEIFKAKLNLADSVGLAEIKRVTAIDTLDLDHNFFVQTIDPLAQLLDLKVLNLANTNIDDLSPIRNLTELVSLNISETKIIDLSPLRYSANLVDLNISNTLVEDISVIEKFANLTDLQMSSILVSDFISLKNLTELKNLNLSDTKISSLALVDSLTKLVSLDVSKTSVADMNSLIGLENIEYLNIDSTLTTDIGAVSNLKSLKVFHMNYTSVSTLDPLLALASLEKIYCDHTGINQAKADAFMKARPNALVIFDSEDLKGWWEDLSLVWRDVLGRTAHIGINPTKEELAKVTNLDSINITNYGSIKNLEPLKKLQKLKVIIAGKSGVSSLSPIKDHREIKTLDISDTQISDLSPLISFKNLKVLRADNSQIENIDTIANNSGLQKIYVDNSSVKDEHVQKFLKRNSKCLVVYKTTLLEKWWNELSDEWKQVFQTQVKVDVKPTRENLHALVELPKISFADIAVSDLTPLLLFINLNELHFKETAIQNISPLVNIKSLRSLHASDNPIRDIAPLSELTELTDLDISNTPADDLRSVGNLQNLRSLNCSGTQIKKLDPLEKLKGLESLDCSNTKVADLKSVTHLPLKSLKCYNTKISGKEVQKFKESKPDCNVVFYK